MVCSGQLKTRIEFLRYEAKICCRKSVPATKMIGDHAQQALTEMCQDFCFQSCSLPRLLKETIGKTASIGLQDKFIQNLATLLISTWCTTTGKSFNIRLLQGHAG